jgi:ABC-type branched-subunit amino acid transport system permease subunit
MSIKKSAWKDAVGFFFVMLAAAFIWNLIGGPKESIGHIFGVAAIGAVLMFVFKSLA